MKIFFSKRSEARNFKSRVASGAAKVVDLKNAPSAKGSRWAVELKSKVSTN